MPETDSRLRADRLDLERVGHDVRIAHVPAHAVFLLDAVRPGHRRLPPGVVAATGDEDTEPAVAAIDEPAGEQAKRGRENEEHGDRGDHVHRLGPRSKARTESYAHPASVPESSLMGTDPRW